MKKIVATVPRNQFFKGPVFSDVLSYLNYTDFQALFQCLDKYYLLEMAEIVLPKVVVSAIRTRFEDAPQKGPLSPIHAAMIVALNRYLMLDEEFAERTIDISYLRTYRFNELKMASGEAHFGYAIYVPYKDLTLLGATLFREGRISYSQFEYLHPSNRPFAAPIKKRVYLDDLKSTSKHSEKRPLGIIASPKPKQINYTAPKRPATLPPIAALRKATHIRKLGYSKDPRLNTNKGCVVLVRTCPESFEFIPNSKKTDDMCFAAVLKDGLLLRYVPTVRKTDDICLSAVKQNGMALEFVPERLRRHVICVEAIKQDVHALKFVPDKVKSVNLFLALINRDPTLLNRVPPHYRTPALCVSAISRYGLALKDVPHDLKDESMCRLALQNNGLALAHVPQDMVTIPLCVMAFKQNIAAFYAIPEPLKTVDLWAALIEVAPRLADLRYDDRSYIKKPVPKYIDAKKNGCITTSDLRRLGARGIAAIQDDEFVWLQLPGTVLLTKPICRTAILKGVSLRGIPSHFVDESLGTLALHQDPAAIPSYFRYEAWYVRHLRDRVGNWFVEPMRTQQLWLLMIAQDASLLADLPESLKTRSMYMMAAKKNKETLPYMPSSIYDEANAVVTPPEERVTVQEAASEQDFFMWW